MKKYDEFEVNGARIGIYPMKEVEAVEIMLDFKAGSRYEKGKNWGAMHLLEHMVHEGTKYFPKREAIDNYKERYGISSNAFTGSSTMRFWFRFPSQSFGAALKLIEEIVFNPVIPDSLLEREKKVVFQEYQDKWSSPYKRFYKGSNEFLFGLGHPYVRDGLGQPQYVNKITADKLRNIHKDFIVPANLSVGVAGKVDIKTVKHNFEKLLENRTKGIESKMFEKLIKPKKTYYYHKEDVEHAVIYVDWFTPGYNESDLKEEALFQLTRYILGNSPLSLLFYKLRQEMGIAYSAGASYSTFPKMGYFEVHTSTDYMNVSVAVETIIKVVNNFLESGVNSSRFHQAKKFRDMQMLLSYDSVGGIANSLVYDLFYYHRIIPLDEYRKIVASITQKEMLKFVSKYLSKKPHISVMSKKEVEL